MSRYEKFKNKRFSPQYSAVLDSIIAIIKEYQAQELDLSLRQLYYQLVARDLFPDAWVSKTTGSKNCFENYKRVVTLVGDGREAGRLPWDAIVDRNRQTQRASTWDSPADILDSAAASWRTDLWRDQPWHVHVMVEKDALSGVIWPVCRQLGVEFTANKGYSSLTMLYWTAKGFQRLVAAGKRVLLLYLGDHDPSGIDMTRDVEERLLTFSGLYSSPAHHSLVVKRLALNYDQVEKYGPPENFVKETDSRSGAYSGMFGDTCWELDALEPTVIRDLVNDEITAVIDFEKWDAAKREQEIARLGLGAIAEAARSVGLDEVVFSLPGSGE